MQSKLIRASMQTLLHFRVHSTPMHEYNTYLVSHRGDVDHAVMHKIAEGSQWSHLLQKHDVHRNIN
jgi:hypothetical protein